MDLYNKKKRLLTAQEHVNDKSILKENIDKILEFENDLLAEGLSSTRILRYHYDLVKLGEFLKKPLKEASSEDLKEFVRQMDSRDYSEWTKNSFRVTLKRFYKDRDYFLFYKKILKEAYAFLTVTSDTKINRDTKT